MNASTIANTILASMLSHDDINVLIRAINRKRQMMSFAAADAFKRGDNVEFLDRRSGLTVQGVILKIMPKNIKVLSRAGTTWTVSPVLLKTGSAK